MFDSCESPVIELGERVGTNGLTLWVFTVSEEFAVHALNTKKYYNSSKITSGFTYKLLQH